MNREYLEGLGLEKDVIDKIMAEHGKGIEKFKEDVKVKEAEVETLQGQLEVANGKISEFKDMDIESIKEEAEEYKKKFEETEKEKEKEIESLKFEHSLEKTINEAKARNTVAVKALLNLEELRKSKNQEEDIKKALESVKEENDYLFDTGETEDSEEVPKFMRPSGAGKIKDTIKKEDYLKLSYKERAKLYENDPTLYKKIME